MYYLDFLGRLHARISPRTYLEIGIRTGGSLALSRVPSIGIDPAFAVTSEIAAPARLFRTTSDEYFQREQPLEPFDNAPIDLAFIDGMHLSEFALRDFINVEKHCHWASVVVFDDMLPRTIDEAARDRHTVQWTGDVYKVIGILRRLRPDLTLTVVGTKPTGLLIVSGLDPDSRVLEDAYPELEAECLSPDPQNVPSDLLAWTGALEPEEVLTSDAWDAVREARLSGASRESGHAALRDAVASGLSTVAEVGPPAIPAPNPWPKPAAPSKPAAKKAPTTPRPRWRREASRVLRGLDRRIR
jgi:hypothetical protein